MFAADPGLDAARSIPIREIAERYTTNLRRAGRDLVGACPVCGGHDRFAVHTGRNIWLCRGCDASGDGIDLVRHVEGVEFREAVEILTGEGGGAITFDPIARMNARVRQVAEEQADERKRIAAALGIWSETQDAAGTIVEDYLSRHRALALDGPLRSVLRFHPSCPFGPGVRLPCMVAAMRNVLTGEITGIHRTALDATTAAKIDRLTLGVLRNAVVMLDPVGRELTVAEGIESAMSARMVGLRPAWAAGSSGTVGKLPVLDGVERIKLCEETNDGGVSARDVSRCGTRWQDAGRAVTVIRPTAGSDLNDDLRSRA